MPTLTSAATQSPPRRISPFWQSEDEEFFTAFVEALDALESALPPPTYDAAFEYRRGGEEREERTSALRMPGMSTPRIPPREGSTSALIPLLSTDAYSSSLSVRTDQWERWVTYVDERKTSEGCISLDAVLTDGRIGLMNVLVSGLRGDS